MSSIEAIGAEAGDKIILTVSIANSKFVVDSEYAKVSDFFTTWLEGHPEIVSENTGGPDANVSLDVLKGITMPEVVIENIIKYMNITKGIRQDILPYPLKEILPNEKGMRAYLCKVRETPLPPVLDDDEEKMPEPSPETSDKPEEPYNFALADFIDEYVEANGMLGLYEMMGYSNYLGIKPLLYLCCGKMALMMKDKSLEEIKTLVDCFPSENGVTEGCDC